MDIDTKIAEIFSAYAVAGNLDYAKKKLKKLVGDVLKDVRDSGHELGGMAEYGQGWNDCRISGRLHLRGLIDKWEH